MTKAKAFLVINREGRVRVIVPQALGKELMSNTLKAATQGLYDLG
jgi:hypothetical protein